MTDFKADFSTFLKYPEKLNELRARFIANLRALNVDVDDTELLNSLISKVSDRFIQTGINPTGQAYVTSNGTFDVTNYATVLVDVPKGLALPTLNAPSITRSGDTLNISNPNTNGNFKKGFKIYNDIELVKSQTASTLSLKSLEVGAYDLNVTCYGENFNDSSKSNSIHVEVYSIDYSLTELSKSTTETKISDGLTHQCILTPSRGWWLPEKISVLVNGKNSEDYTYDSYSGDISYKAIGNVEFIATADEEPYLRKPVISFSDVFNPVLTIEDVKYAQWYDVFVNEDLAETVEVVETTTTDVQKVSGVAYGWTQSGDYFVPGNSKKPNSFALCKVVISAQEDTTLNIEWMQQSESGYDYAIISTLDQVLSSSANADTSNVLKNFKGITQTTPATLSIEVPAGEHFFYVKYRKDGSGDTGWDQFKFKIIGGSMLASQISVPKMAIDDYYIIALENESYDSGATANITWEIYINDILAYEEKEGV